MAYLDGYIGMGGQHISGSRTLYRHQTSRIYRITLAKQERELASLGLSSWGENNVDYSTVLILTAASSLAQAALKRRGEG